MWLFSSVVKCILLKSCSCLDSLGILQNLDSGLELVDWTVDFDRGQGRDDHYPYLMDTTAIIEASRSEPHINHSYEKTAVHLYVCMYSLYVYTYVCEVCVVAIRRPRGHGACAQSMR